MTDVTAEFLVESKEYAQQILDTDFEEVDPLWCGRLANIVMQFTDTIEALQEKVQLFKDATTNAAGVAEELQVENQRLRDSAENSAQYAADVTDEETKAALEERVQLEWRDNRKPGQPEWSAPCGCAFHYYEGDEVSPHWHVCGQHQARPTLDADALANWFRASFNAKDGVAFYERADQFISCFDVPAAEGLNEEDATVQSVMEINRMLGSRITELEAAVRDAAYLLRNDSSGGAIWLLDDVAGILERTLAPAAGEEK